MAFIIFQNPGSNWVLYDRETNKFFQIFQTDAMTLQGHLGQEERNDKLQHYQAQGVCCDSILETIEHPSTPYLKHFLENQVSDLVLQVTPFLLFHKGND